MLRPAHIGHLALLRSLIRDAARDGAFDPALAWDSPAATRFFGELRQALKTGYFVVEDQASGTVRTVAVPGYVYFPMAPNCASAPGRMYFAGPPASSKTSKPSAPLRMRIVRSRY